LDASYTGSEQTVGSRFYITHICSRREEKQEKINNPGYKARHRVVKVTLYFNVCFFIICNTFGFTIFLFIQTIFVKDSFVNRPILEYVRKAEALTKFYDYHRVLDNFSMNITKGSYRLVGKKRDWKKTLLRLICGLQEATSEYYTLYGVSKRKHDFLNARKETSTFI